MHIGKLTALGNSLAVVIPRSVLRELAWSRGDYIAVGIDEGEVLLQNVHRQGKKFRLVKGADTRNRNAETAS